MYTADLGFLGHEAQQKLAVQKMMIDMVDKNTKEREDYLSNHPSVMEKDEKTGKWSANPMKVAAIRNAVRNMQGAPNPLQPTASWLPYADAASTTAGLNAPTGKPFQTVPTGAEYSPITWQDLSWFKGANFTD